MRAQEQPFTGKPTTAESKPATQRLIKAATFLCVEADFDFEHRAITIFIAVGTADKGVSGAPALFSATITEPDGKVKSLRQLGELPKELHRPLPKSPRNVPDPAVRSGNSGVLTISSG